MKTKLNPMVLAPLAIHLSIDSVQTFFCTGISASADQLPSGAVCLSQIHEEYP